jgi:chemotaxis protein MotB
VFETSNTQIPLSDSEAVPFSKVQVVENSERTTDLERFVQPMKGVLVPSANKPMKDVQAQLEKALAPEIQRKVVDVKARREGLVISLREIGFFASGSAAIESAGQSALDRLGDLLAKRTESLRIEGHTDNVPIHNGQFKSNWELSTARASELMRVFVTRFQMDPARFSIAGYAEYHPVSANDTPDGRARNRRVDIVILNPPRFAPMDASNVETGDRNTNP